MLPLVDMGVKSASPLLRRNMMLRSCDHLVQEGLAVVLSVSGFSRLNKGCYSESCSNRLQK